MEKFDYTYAYNMALALSRQPRFTGTEGERQARELIVRELESLGYNPSLEKFSVKTYDVVESELEIVKPRSKKVECSVLGFSGETPIEGVEGDILYIENADSILLPEATGWIGLASQRPSREYWKRLIGKASGLVIVEGSPYRELSRVAIPYEWREKMGSLPSVYVRYRDAYELLSAERARLKVVQTYRDAETYNIFATVEGSKYPDEVVYVTAHYDSVQGVPGATDNAGGTAMVLALAKALSASRPKRTVRFALFGAEELGLRGSLFHVNSLSDDEKKKIKAVVNLDVHGGIFGSSAAIISGAKSLRYFVEALAKRVGVNLSISEDVMSSDGSSFAKHGIPAVNLYRASGSGVDIHTVRDSSEHLHPIAFKTIGYFTLLLLEEILNAEEIPFEREIPEDIKKKVEEYFSRRQPI
ncbi:MAG: M20/M25/M40 family metallo-hydrolase [Thermofilum sp.]|nr:M20/M25/M40 family metallo-hydrolase [Thermofilum sp.]